MEAEYPTRGFNVEAPATAETEVTGVIATIRFERRGNRYVVVFSNERYGLFCTKNGAVMEWDAFPSIAKKVAHQAAKFLSDATKIGT